MQELVEILKAVERLGIATRVGVYAGANEPFPHTFANYTEEVALFGDAIDYVGAYATPPPSASDLVPPPDGFASVTQPKALNAVDFIIEQVKKYPGEVTILEIAPAENLANAILKDPSIVPLIKQVRTNRFRLRGPLSSPKSQGGKGDLYDDCATRKQVYRFCRKTRLLKHV